MKQIQLVIVLVGTLAAGNAGRVAKCRTEQTVTVEIVK